MFENLEKESPVLQILAVAGLISTLLFAAGLLLGFLLGIHGRVPGYGGRVQFENPAAWINFFKEECIEKLNRQTLIVTILFSPLFLGTLIGGCLGALIPPMGAIGIIAALAGLICLVSISGAETYFIVGGGRVAIGAGGMLSVMALITIFAL